MARINEYQGKALLRENGIAVPEGGPAFCAEEARRIAERIGGPVVLKAQVWVTGRFAKGLIRFARSPAEAYEKAGALLGRMVNNFPVECLLVEKRLSVAGEYYAGIIISDTRQRPEIIFSAKGGTGIEEIAAKYPGSLARTSVKLSAGFREYHARNMIRKTGISGAAQRSLADILVRLWKTARRCEARSAEINPIIETTEGQFLAADCRITIDDYAVFRHPELGIEIAREFDHPPTELEKTAYDLEKNDYRGTFYFIQLEKGFRKGEKYVGFHGAGGGGSMMSMDAIQQQGYRIANFTDTSGNPPASKVYRAARIILSQGGIDGYFGSGSGVASQEQVNSARGLVKAFREEALDVPAVIRLGGNMEDEAVSLLTRYTQDLPGAVEGYKKDDPAAFCARRLAELIGKAAGKSKNQKRIEYTARNLLRDAKVPLEFKTLTGRVVFDHHRCASCESKICIDSCDRGVLRLKDGLPVLAIPAEKAAGGGCTECLACELECWFKGCKGAFVELPIPGLAESEPPEQPEQDRGEKP